MPPTPDSTITQQSAGGARRLACARCGAAFDCGLGVQCWCQAEPYRLPMNKATDEDCLCPACLRQTALEAGLSSVDS